MFARTERLLLRPGWKEDAPALQRAMGDQAIMGNFNRYTWPYELKDAEDYVHRSNNGLLPQLLIFARTRGAPRLVGGIWLHRNVRDEVELGYWIARSYWGLGFATEAAKALIAMARDTLGIQRIVASPATGNSAAIGVLEKLGFRPSRIESLMLNDSSVTLRYEWHRSANEDRPSSRKEAMAA